MPTKTMLIFAFLVSFLLFTARCQNLYNWNPTSMRNQTWMGALDYGLPLRQMSILGTHNSVVFDSCFFITATTQQCQANSLQVQLESGIRAIDIHVKHLNNQFQVTDRGCAQGTSFNQVLATVKSFLTTYPTETVIMRLVEESGASGCSRTFQDTFISYRDANPGLFWIPTTQDPQLGEVRAQIVLLQDFSSVTVHGMLMATFSVLPHKYFSNNWVLYDKWLEIKNFLPGVNSAKKSKISFWTGHGASYPYFVVSGKSSPTGSRLSTGLTTPGFKSSYPDFPRVACFIGICTIAFEGMNIMAYNFIVNNGHTYTGIIYTDLYGDDLLRMAVGKNTAVYAKCSTLQVSQGCTLCQLGTGTCLKCNTNLNYVYDSVNKICLAKVGYYLDATYFPQLCSLAEPGCMECTSVTMCTKCDVLLHYLLSAGQCIAEPGYYLDALFVPTLCPQIGCAECSDAITCTLCSTPLNYIIDTTTGITCKCDDLGFFQPAPTTQACICMTSYFLSSLGTCDPMPHCPDMQPIGGCINCDLVTDPLNPICIECNATSHFIMDPTNVYCICAPSYYYDGTACLSCTIADPACDDCVSASLCLSCLDNFTLTAGVCKCNFQYYLVNPSTCNLCATGCLICSDLVTCTLCDASKNYMLVNGICQCVTGMYSNAEVCQPCNTMAGCIDCNTAGCTLCDPIFGFLLSSAKCVCSYGFFINSMKICEQCMAEGCLNCLDQTQCIQCDPSLYFLTPSGTCNDTCGDGFRIHVDCDDGNLIDGDGCSSTCTVETDYTCTGGSISTKDTCSYSGPFYLTVIKTIKEQKRNKVYIEMIIKPNLASLTGIDFSVAINPTFPYDSKTAVFDSNKSQINFEFIYSSSLNHLTSNDLNITFDPPNSIPEYFYMKSTSVTMPEITDNNRALKSYDQSIYNLLDLMQTLTEITAFLYIGVCFFCFLFVSKLIAIELILVPQVAFAGLIMIEKIEALLEPLNNFKLTNGYNPFFTDNIQIPSRLQILFYQGQFLSNFNICLVVLAIPVIIGLFLLILGKVRNSKILCSYSYKTLKEWAFSILLIFQFQFTISFGIDFLYGTLMIGKVLGGVLFAALITFIVLLYKRPLNFGEFKNYFQKSPFFLNHYAFVVFFRLLLAVDLIIFSSNKACGFAAIGITAFYTLFLIISRPYEKNVRPILNLVVILAILSVETVYKLNFYSSDATFITNYLPLFIVALLLALLLINVIFMIIEAKLKYKKKQINEYQKNEDDSFDLEMKKQLQKQMEVVNTIQLALNPSKIQERIKMKTTEEPSELLKGISELKEKQKQLMQKSIILQATPTNLSATDKLLYTEI